MRTEHSEALEYADQNVMSELGKAMDLYFGGDMNASIALTGQVAGRIDAVKPVTQILRETVAEFQEAVEALTKRYGAPSRA